MVTQQNSQNLTFSSATYQKPCPVVRGSVTLNSDYNNILSFLFWKMQHWWSKNILINCIFFSASSELVSHAALFVPSLNAPPQQMAAHIQTTFLSRFEPITAMEPLFFGTVLWLIILLHMLSNHSLHSIVSYIRCRAVSRKAV